MVKDKNFYDVLGIGTDADEQQIKQAYRALAIKFHPDRHHSADEAEKKKMSERFKTISRAYEVLSDETLKRRYDQLGEKGLENDGGPDPSMFSGMGGFPFAGGGAGFPFGGGFPFAGMPQMQPTGGFSFGKATRPSVPPIKTVLKLSLEEVYCGKTCTIKFDRQEYCTGCDGKGGAEVEKCSTCSGRGVVTKIRQMAPGMMQQSQTTCQKCSGEGKRILKPCLKCNGKRLLTREVQERVEIPKGAKHGDMIALEKKGHNIDKKVEAGDVVIILEVEPHSRFTRQGKNLIYETKIDLVEALCGGSVVVDHLDGHQIVVKLKTTIQQDQLYCIHQEGMPVKNSVEKGDLVIKFVINFPTDLNDKAKQALIQALGRSSRSKAKVKDNHYETELHLFHGRIENCRQDGDEPTSKDGDSDDSDANPFIGASGARGGPQPMQCQQQ